MQCKRIIYSIIIYICSSWLYAHDINVSLDLVKTYSINKSIPKDVAHIIQACNSSYMHDSKATHFVKTSTHNENIAELHHSLSSVTTYTGV